MLESDRSKVAYRSACRIFFMFIKFVASDVCANTFAAARYEKTSFSVYFYIFYHLLREIMARSDDKRADFFDDNDAHSLSKNSENGWIKIFCFKNRGLCVPLHHLR